MDEYKLWEKKIDSIYIKKNQTNREGTSHPLK